MSDSNVEQVRKALDAWGRRDLETTASLVDSDLEIVPAFASAVEGQTFQGPHAVEDFFRSVDSFFESFSTTPEEFRAIGEDRVLVLGRVKAHGSASGVELDQQWGSLWTLAEGRITRVQTFFDHRAALAAAGVSE